MKPRGLVSTTALVLGGLLGGAILGEVAVRLYAWWGTSAVAVELRRRDPMKVLVEPHGELAFRQKPNSEFRYQNGTAAHSNALGFRGPAVELPKPPATLRIVLLGGSTMHGWGVNDDQTVDAYMRQLIADAYPGLRAEVVNLAFDGYDSYQDFARLRDDGLRLDPDLIIVHNGINDVRNTRITDLRDPDPRAALWAAELSRLREERSRGRPSWRTSLQHWSYLARFPSIARDAAFVNRATVAALTVNPNDAALDYYERNLTRIGRLAGARGIPVLFSTAPSALATYDPHTTSSVSYWIHDAGTTQRYRDLLAERMRGVVKKLQADHAAAQYVAHTLERGLFLDDTHLTAAGNRALARAFIADLRLFPSIRARLKNGPPAQPPGSSPLQTTAAN